MLSLVVKSSLSQLTSHCFDLKSSSICFGDTFLVLVYWHRILCGIGKDFVARKKIHIVTKVASAIKTKFTICDQMFT